MQVVSQREAGRGDVGEGQVQLDESETASSRIQANARIPSP